MRLQTLTIALQNYDIILRYKLGLKLRVTDILSRVSQTDTQFEIIQTDVATLINLLDYASITPEGIQGGK